MKIKLITIMIVSAFLFSVNEPSHGSKSWCIAGNKKISQASAEAAIDFDPLCALGCEFWQDAKCKTGWRYKFLL